MPAGKVIGASPSYARRQIAKIHATKERDPENWLVKQQDEKQSLERARLMGGDPGPDNERKAS